MLAAAALIKMVFLYADATRAGYVLYRALVSNIAA
jgi:hypothetical protein